jgi:hypothetical protein
LSNHAFGGAFDINDQWNGLGETPALVGARGCVRELVEIANRFGFFWGGHYSHRPDGMHFEIARLLTEKAVADASGALFAARLPDSSARNYNPPSTALPVLGDITNLLPSARRIMQGFVVPPKILAVLPDGQLFFDSEMQLDTDGAPEVSGDATHQTETSLRYSDGTSINANRVPFVVLPLPISWSKQFGIGLGDFAAVIFGGRISFAVFADFGPKSKIGEGSLELFRRLGQERIRSNGSVHDVGMGPGVITIVFPNTAGATDLENETALLTAVQSRGSDLFTKIGGKLPVNE